MSSSAAQNLVDLIAQAVKDIEADTATQIPGATTTGINLPVVAPEDDLDVTPKRRAAIRTLKGATHQLLATLMPASLYALEIQSSYFQTVAINIAIKGKIADLIHSIDPDSSKGGVNVEVLAEKAGTDPGKLTHILRFLALRNIFCELSLNHWGNTRLSIPLRTDSINTVYNFIINDSGVISSPVFIELPNVLFDKEGDAAFSRDRFQSAFHRYYKPDGDFFDFLAKSDGGRRAITFAKGMAESEKFCGRGELQGFEWQKLGPTGVLVDVGGGIGGTALLISAHLPGWNIVVQDRAEVIKQAKETTSTAKVVFEEADFMKDQPSHRIGTVDAYFLRHILHNWPFQQCVGILTKLRAAAKPTTRLLICDMGLEPPLVDPNAPILLNGGMASSLAHNVDLMMLSLFNAEERSKQEFSDIFNASGWILQEAVPLKTLEDRFIFEGVPNPAWK